jgi:hypothetical protein
MGTVYSVIQHTHYASVHKFHGTRVNAIPIYAFQEK